MSACWTPGAWRRPVPGYASSEQLFHCLQKLFAYIAAESPGAGDALLGRHLVTRLRISEPAAEIATNARRHPLQIIYGPSPLRPDLEVEMRGDTLHRILLDELLLTKAVGSAM